MTRDGYHQTRRPWQPNDRQRQVLDLLVEGKSNAEIAVRLGISVNGAKWHISELLAEAGVEDRRALALWWEEARQKRETGFFLPIWLVARRIGVWPVVGLVILVAIAWRIWSNGGGSQDTRLLTESPSVDGGFLAGGQIKESEPKFEDFLVALTVEGGDATSRVDLRDAKTGARLASVESGYQPMVLVRDEAEELLVASGRGPIDDNGFKKQLEIYDLHGYSMQLKQTIPTPDRVNCTTYCQPMVLSNDERYVYYATRVTAPECGAGGDAAVCDVHSVVVIDLDDDGAPPKETELRRGCGVPILSPAGESDALVTCRGQYPVTGGSTVLIRSDGTSEELEPGFGTIVFNSLTADGATILITNMGSAIKKTPAGQTTTASVLPNDLGFVPRVVHQGATDLGDGRLFIVFDDSHFGSHDRKYGFVIFDTKTMTEEGYGRVPDATYYLPNGDSVYVLRSGRIEVLDLASGRISTLASSVGSSVEVLLPGR